MKAAMSRRLIRATALLVAAAAGPVGAQTMEGTIVGASERPAVGSGVLAMYATAVILPRGGKLTTLFFTYFGEGQFLPKQGDRCRVGYRLDSVAGNLRTTSLYVDRVPVVRWISCSSGSWSEREVMREWRRRSAMPPEPRS